MSKEIEVKKGELEEANQTLRNKELELRNLQAKKSELCSNGDGRTADITAAQNRRQETLAAFVTGRASQEDLNQATKVLDELQKTAALSQEMLHAIDAAILKTEAEIQKSKAAIGGARRGLYEAIYDELKQEIQGKIGDRVSCAVAVRSRYGISPTDTMSDIFSDSGCISVIDEAARAVEAEFQIEF